MKKCIKKNLYAAVDVMAVITLLLLVAFFEKKTKPIYWLSAGCITFMIAACQAAFGQSKIENGSGEDVYTKSEEGCNAIQLEPGGSRYDIDGVKSRGVVYKLVDGCHGVVRKDGTLKVKSFTGKFVNSVRGGVLSSPPDECWRTLFEA